MTSNLLQGLNPQQHAAVTADDGPVLVLAGPGSGKTSVLTRRIAYLIQERDVKPWHILAVTFTNKAAKEMTQRVTRLLGKPAQVRLGTFHANCARILRIEHHYIDYPQDYVIYDTDDQLKAVQQAMGELNVSTKKFSPRGVLSSISNAKNEMRLPPDFQAHDYFTEVVSRIYPRYQAILLDSSAMDFDDLLLNTVRAFEKHADLRHKYQERYPYVMVDEFQDTNAVQYRLMQLLGAPQNNIFAVGDEDQSIYAFRGATPENVQHFRRDYPSAEVILLEQNYRSTQIVLDVAKAVIDRNTGRTQKNLFTDRDGGDLVTLHEAYDDEYEARFIVDTIEEMRGDEGYAYDDFAVMYRTNAQSRALEDACIRMGLPYTLVGGVGFYKRREIRDMIAYLRVVSNPDDKMSFNRIINTPKRGIGKKSLADFHAWTAKTGMGYGEALEKIVAGDSTPLSTRAASNFAAFGERLQTWQTIAAEGDLLKLFDAIQNDVGYTLYLHDISDTPEQANERSENLKELRGLLALADDEDQSLSEFLIDIMLMTDADTADASDERVTLLTLHAAKGLEYPVVFITGLESGILPHSRAFDEPDGLQEERRLFYVGITRAERKLFLTYAFKRTRYGYSEAQEPSAFLADIPQELVEGESAMLKQQGDEASYSRMTTWDSGSSPSDKINELRQTLADKLKANKERNASRKRGHVSDEKIRGKIIPFPGGDADDALQYSANQRVRHPLFGNGTVIESQRVDGNEQVTVAFKDRKYGVKTLDAEFANMTILD